MSGSERADTNALEQTFLLNITYSFPAFFPSLWPADRPMNEVEINVSETAFLKRSVYRLLHVVISVIEFKFSCEKYVRAGDAIAAAEI